MPHDDTSTYYAYRTPHGLITIGVTAGAISEVRLGEAALAGTCKPASLSNRCATELLEYFSGKRTVFDLPTAPEGSAFQRQAWQAMQAIPYGQTYTMKDVANAMGRPRSYRAVGCAVRQNPLAILVPAHRVVGSDGRITGADNSARLRQAFLDFERRNA